MQLKNWKEYQAEHGDYLTRTAIQTIQTDTLALAAEIAGDPANENYCGGSTGNARGTSKQIKSAIMAAMPNVES